MPSELVTFAQGELQRLKRARQDAIEAKGGRPYLPSLKIGETKLLLMPEVPKENVKDGRVRREFVVSAQDPESLAGELKEYSWTVNTANPLYRELCSMFCEMGALPRSINVVRTGEGRSDTRYSVRWAD